MEEASFENIENYTDEKIAGFVQSGQEDFFGVLMDRYKSKMLRYAKRFLFNSTSAEDLVQDVFVNAYVNINGFDTSKKFSPWLYRIAHNYFVNEIKKRNRNPLIFLDLDTLLPHLPHEEGPVVEAIDKELKEELEICLDKIDLKYKEVLILYFFEGLSYKEIAEILHIPTNVVGVRINRGKKMIKRDFKI